MFHVKHPSNFWFPEPQYFLSYFWLPELQYFAVENFPSSISGGILLSSGAQDPQVRLAYLS